MDLPSATHLHPGERGEEEDVCEWCQREALRGAFGMHHKQWRQNRRWCQGPETWLEPHLCLDSALTTFLFYLRVVSDSL